MRVSCCVINCIKYRKLFDKDTRKRVLPKRCGDNDLRLNDTAMFLGKGGYADVGDVASVSITLLFCAPWQNRVVTFQFLACLTKVFTTRCLPREQQNQEVYSDLKLVQRASNTQTRLWLACFGNTILTAINSVASSFIWHVIIIVRNEQLLFCLG